MSQASRLLDYLQVNKSIDPLKAWSELGIYRLGARIHDLKRAGYNIVTDRKKVYNRFGEPCNVAVYLLV
jgi:hypothetical protein